MSGTDSGGGSIAGGWLGTYYYRSGLHPPVRFEATFTSNGDGAFGGTILDDGPRGDAVVSHGMQTGRIVRFRKSYRRAHAPGGTATAIRYMGTLSEDGDSVRGTWQMTFRHHDRLVRSTGRWDARRLWGGASGEEAIIEEREIALEPALR